MNKTLHAYYAQLTADLDSLYTADAFDKNQVLPLVAEQQPVSFAQPVTYYIPELDKLESIPASSLRFIGYEPIDEEHYFYFFTVKPGKVYDRLKATGRVLRATLALVSLQGYNRLLVQHVEAISESGFITEHEAVAVPFRAMAS